MYNCILLKYCNWIGTALVVYPFEKQVPENFNQKPLYFIWKKVVSKLFLCYFFIFESCFLTNARVCNISKGRDTKTSYLQTNQGTFVSPLFRLDCIMFLYQQHLPCSHKVLHSLISRDLNNIFSHNFPALFRT